MDGLVIKRRRKLNTEQLEVLNLLYKFRFGTNDLFAQYFGKKDRSFMYKRLTILLEQGLVGKRFEPSYRLQGKPAAYYLTPDGARELQITREVKVNIKAIYKDGAVSEQFVNHSLELFAIYNRLRMQYGDELKFFTKADMNHEEYDYFPRPLPDAYMRLKAGDKHFFLDVFHDDQPYFVMKRRVAQYIKYDDSADWAVTGTSLPVVLAVCESLNLANRMQKYVTKALDDAWTDADLVMVTTTRPDLLTSASVIWRKTTDLDDTSVLYDLGSL